MSMKLKPKQIRVLKVCLILFLAFSIFPDVIFSQVDTIDKVEIESASSEGTNSCDEHNCPLPPDEPCHHCAVCCSISHFFSNQSTGVSFHFDNTPQAYSMDEDALYNELFANTLFRPPQSIL